MQCFEFDLAYDEIVLLLTQSVICERPHTLEGVLLNEPSIKLGTVIGANSAIAVANLLSTFCGSGIEICLKTIILFRQGICITLKQCEQLDHI